MLKSITFKVDTKFWEQLYEKIVFHYEFHLRFLLVTWGVRTERGSGLRSILLPSRWPNYENDGSGVYRHFQRKPSLLNIAFQCCIRKTEFLYEKCANLCYITYRVCSGTIYLSNVMNKDNRELFKKRQRDCLKRLLHLG